MVSFLQAVGPSGGDKGKRPGRRAAWIRGPPRSPFGRTRRAMSRSIPATTSVWPEQQPTFTPTVASLMHCFRVRHICRASRRSPPGRDGDLFSCGAVTYSTNPLRPAIRISDAHPHNALDVLDECQVSKGSRESLSPQSWRACRSIGNRHHEQPDFQIGSPRPRKFSSKILLDRPPR
jgi:hypothetical protein